MKVPVTNNTKMPMFVAGVMIPPGETKHFEDHHVPASLRDDVPADETEEAPQDPLLAILDGRVADIVNALPNLADEQYQQLKAAEEAGKTRKSLLAAFAEEDLRRADAQADANADNSEQAQTENSEPGSDSNTDADAADENTSS